MSTVSISRRDFLKSGGSLVIAFSLPVVARYAIAASAEGKPVSLDRVESFLAIGADGAVTCYSGKVDLGTGVQTALMQIVADELTVPLERVRMVMGDTLLTPDQGPTSGSLAIEVGGTQIRQAAATARAALTSEAAKLWQVDTSEVTTADGVVRTKSGARSISYGDLVRGKGLALPVNAQAPLLDPSRYRLVGRSVPRVDIPAKVTGEFVFMQDFRVPGMVHARVVRPPAIGARLLTGSGNGSSENK
jgi:Aerobic-type carbon monoxide dehydrogenase, large subunit CoxL/CutL homologs